MISLLALAAVSTALAADDPLRLRDPTFYDVLGKGARLECHYLQDGMNGYGLLLERGTGDVVHISILNNGVNEGAKSAFDAAIQSSGIDGKYLQFKVRDGEFGTTVEIVIESRISADVGYGLPGRVMFATTTYVPGQNGKEQEQTQAAGTQRMSCTPPMPGRLGEFK